MTRLAAVFLFNHRFEKNVETLEAMYRDRFTSRRYIMPFTQNDDPRMVPVYETSWNFSGHLAQAWPRIRVEDAAHYVVIADDLVLNPQLHEGNLLERLGVGPRAGYIKSLASIDSNRYRWHRALPESMRFDETDPGFDYKAELPSAEAARARFEGMGVPFRFPAPRSLREARLTVHRFRPLVGTGNYLRWARRRTSYPLLYGYADFLVIPAHAMPGFIRYCGILAALNVFAEVAVPTALALATDEIVTEMEVGEHFEWPGRRRADAVMEGIELWGAPRIQAFVEGVGRSLDRLAADYPENRLYVHPVKLSQFR
jgi:hypothetical protein